MNGTMMQYFHWDLPPDGTLWDELARNAADLARAGITAVWVPPVSKGTSGSDVGYGSYDLWDLGEFDQKGSVRTKYGTRAQLEAAVAAVHDAGMQVYLDVVFNHKGGADATEVTTGTPVNWDNRNQDVGPPREIEVWTQFTFPGRGMQYSEMQWHWWHFDAVDYDARTGSAGTIFRLRDKRFDTPVSREFGNYDYLLFDDIDMDNEEAKADLRNWGEWIVRTLGADGFRFDAAKHIRAFFFNEWLDHLHATFPDRQFFGVGEHFTGDPNTLRSFLTETGGRMSLFDFPLYFNMRNAARRDGNFDMRSLLTNTLVSQDPVHAVTFVDNHDTFRHDDERIADWFKPHAYALILLREQGYPCLFYGDYYGADGRVSHRDMLDPLLAARRDHAYGPQRDVFDHNQLIGWARLGDDEHPRSMAVVMSNAGGGTKSIPVDRPNASFRDATGAIGDTVTTDGNGVGQFRCLDASVSVWVQQD
jgi:alpha-amylase